MRSKKKGVVELWKSTTRKQVSGVDPPVQNGCWRYPCVYTNKTMTLTVAIYSEVIRSNFGNAAAYSTILTLTSILSLLIFFRVSGSRDLSI